jgi:hypothetical protein
MTRYEYRVVPAPVQGRKAKGVRGTTERFALALETLMNEMGAEGWEYVRADTLPCEERTGIAGRTTTFQNVLVFRRAADAAGAARAPAVGELLGTPLPEGPEGEAAAQPEPAEGAAPPAAERAGSERAGAAGPKEPPLTRFATRARQPERDPEQPPEQASEAARKAAAALRTYRAAAGHAKDGGDGAGGRKGRGGLAAE